MTAKEIKDYLRTEERILWEELLAEERKIKELEKKDMASEAARRQPAYVTKLAQWGIVYDICAELEIDTY